MKIIVNNKEKEISSDLSLVDLLNEMKLHPQKTLASINGNVISQNRFNNVNLKEKDSVELFSFVGGG